jgi:hypothetical protein
VQTNPTEGNEGNEGEGPSSFSSFPSVESLLFVSPATDLLGPTGTNTFTDLNAAALPTVFYRVGVPQ